MAYIDKVCELSQDYPGWDMYAMKRNHIQIDKKYRPLFKGADAELVIVDIEILFGNIGPKGYCYTLVNEWEILDYFNNDPYGWIDYYAHFEKRKLLFRYSYELRVKDAHLQGEVGGIYSNQSFDMGTVKRKLRRMVGPGLKIRNEALSRSATFKKWAREVIVGNEQRALVEAHANATVLTIDENQRIVS